jgi:DNA primase
VARQAMDHSQDPVFDARGLLGYEARLQADIRVTTLPQGMDPDEVVARDPQEWQRIVSNAKPVVVHVMETLAAGLNIDDPKVKSEIAAQVLPLVEDVPNPIERDTYRQRLARLLRVSERALLETSPARPRSAARRRFTPQPQQPLAPAAASAPIPSSSYVLEMHCLGVLLRRPGLLFQIDRRMQEHGLPRLSPDDFQHTDHQAILRLFQESVDQDMAEPLNFVMNNLSLPLMELADGLLAHTEKLDPNDERVMEDLMRGILELRRQRWQQENEYLRFLIEEAQDQGDVKATQYLQSMVQLAETKRRLDRAVKQYTSHLPVARL